MNVDMCAHIFPCACKYPNKITESMDWREKKKVEEDGKFSPSGTKAGFRITAEETAVSGSDVPTVSPLASAAPSFLASGK